MQFTASNSFQIKTEVNFNLRSCAVTEKGVLFVERLALRECKPYRCAKKRDGNDLAITEHQMVTNRLILLSQVLRSIYTYTQQRLIFAFINSLIVASSTLLTT